MTVAPGEPLAVELAVRATVRVEGRVVDADGRALEGLALALEDTLGEARFEALSDVLGSFVFDGVPAGAQRLAIGSGKQSFLAPIPVEVTAPAVHLGDILVPALGSLRVRIVDADGVPVAGATVRCSGSERGSLEVVTGPAGEVLIAALPGSEGRIFARHDALGRVNHPYVLADGENAAITLALSQRAP